MSCSSPATVDDLCRALEEHGCFSSTSSSYEQCLTINEGALEDYAAAGCATEAQASIECAVSTISDTICTPASTTCTEEADAVRDCLGAP